MCMFGYVIADLGRLTEAQRLRYHSVYCGLCRALYADYGAAGALALTYDMTFLTLLLAALYEPEERSGAARCLRHPVRAQRWASSEFTAYAAAMNCLLAWENCRDDWADEKKLSAAAAGPMQRASSASRVCSASRSASEYTATVAMPISRQACMIRTAISPRLAIKTF